MTLHIEEHAKIRRLTQAVNEANITQPNYDQMVNRAVTAFLEHAAKVENEQLTKIEQNVTAQQSDVRFFSSPNSPVFLADNFGPFAFFVCHVECS
jgi:hypothetical protein